MQRADIEIRRPGEVQLESAKEFMVTGKIEFLHISKTISNPQYEQLYSEYCGEMVSLELPMVDSRC